MPRNEDDMDVTEDQDQLEEELPDKPESWSSEAYFTNANYQAKRFVFLLFINRTLFLPILFCLLILIRFQTDWLNRLG